MVETLLIEHDYGKPSSISINQTNSILKYYLHEYREIKQETDETNNLEKNLKNIFNSIEHENVFIGGDHSVAIATISRVYEPGMKIIWIDAHPDINTFEASISKNYHGMPLAFLTGLDKFSESPELNKNIPFSDILYIGIRSIDDFERKIIDDNNIKYISSDLDNYREIISNFVGNSKVHISLDVDSIDPGDMPCTGTRELTGIPREKMRELMDYLLNFEINSIDIVELNLHLGSFEDSKLSLETLCYVLYNYYIFIDDKRLLKYR